jgi:uncharacterized protein (DUF2249 family)
MSDFRQLPVKSHGAVCDRPTGIPLPPLERQPRIVAELDALQGNVDAVKVLQDHTAAELNATLSAILDKAFKGQLRTRR